MTTLHLTLKKKWFKMIFSGEKNEEYREIKGYWISRLFAYPEIFAICTNMCLECSHRHHIGSSEICHLTDNPIYLHENPKCHINSFEWGRTYFNYFGTVTFRNGYGKKAPTMVVECKGITLGNCRPEWSDNAQGEHFIIHLGKILSTKNC